MSYTWEKNADPKAVMDAIAYLEDATPPVMPNFEPISQRNEHNCHLAARIVAAAAILVGIGWVAYLFWMRV